MVDLNPNSPNVSGTGKTPAPKETGSLNPMDAKVAPKANEPGAVFVNSEVAETKRTSLAEALGVDQEGAAVVDSVASFIGAFRGSKPGANDPTVAALTKRTLDA